MFRQQRLARCFVPLERAKTCKHPGCSAALSASKPLKGLRRPRQGAATLPAACQPAGMLALNKRLFGERATTK
jgi:hypothetical protein